VHLNSPILDGKIVTNPFDIYMDIYSMKYMRAPLHTSRIDTESKIDSNKDERQSKQSVN